MAKKKKRGSAKSRFKHKARSKSEKSSVLSFIKMEFALNLIAALIVLVASIVYIFVPMQITTYTNFQKILVFEILNVVLGVGLLISTLTLRTNPREASVFILVFSILTLIFPPYGFVIGPLIGLIASILILLKLRRR
jgi:hypothetical protein